MNKMIECPDCEGTGITDDGEMCETCKGKGEIEVKIEKEEENEAILQA
jgi:DnaJ-class molecular chaperone